MKEILKKLKLLITLLGERIERAVSITAEGRTWFNVMTDGIKFIDLLFKSNLLNHVKMVMEVYFCGRKFDRGENSRLIFDFALIDFTLERP